MVLAANKVKIRSFEALYSYLPTNYALGSSIVFCPYQQKSLTIWRYFLFETISDILGEALWFAVLI